MLLAVATSGQITIVACGGRLLMPVSPGFSHSRNSAPRAANTKAIKRKSRSPRPNGHARNPRSADLLIGANSVLFNEAGKCASRLESMRASFAEISTHRNVQLRNADL